MKMTKVERIKELVELLNQASEAYYKYDNPIMSDKEYDALMDELENLETYENFILANSPTQKVQGFILEGLQKVEHSKPMLSAAKTKDFNEVKKFICNNHFYCSYKLDGLTMIAKYSDGKFIQAITRGTGLIGEDVTEQAKFISNLPMTIQYKRDLELRGECVISWEQFHKVNETLEEQYSHPRNLAAGTLRNFDTSIVKDRKLSYVVFECVSDLYDEDELFDSKWDELGYLDYLGFETVSRCHGEVTDCIEAMQPELYKYPVDGLIFEYCMKKYSKSLDSTAHHEGCRIAYKWADSTYETILRNVEWNTTRTGLISPVAVFDPVDLDGALTTRATLHNVSIIKQLELGICDTITVYRSNMVIPKVDDNLTRSNTLQIPKSCPCCGAETVIKKTENSQVLICTNPDCTAKKIAQFENFVSRRCMNVEGLSSATLALLISKGYLRNIKDIYALSGHAKELALLPGMGKKSVEKLLQSIEKSREVKLENFICALGINGIGSSASKTISKACSGDWAALRSMWSNQYDFTKLNDFGEITANNFIKYFDEHINDIDELSAEMKFIVPKKQQVVDNPFTGKTLVVTGRLNHFTRDSINEKIVSLGAKTASSVSKKTDWLITNEESGSGKYKKAVELGIPIITELTFLNMIGEM
jgi:DNA ligase (NAD+)